MADAYVYIMASKKWGTIYIGSTTALVQRVWQHRNGLFPGFTSKYGVKRLVWYEVHGCLDSAATRERQMKKWRREWKIRLIERSNPEWEDLWDEVDRERIRE